MSPEENANVESDKSEELTNEEKESQIQKKLEGIENKIDSSQMLNRVMADPNVRAILEARRDGRDIEVVDKVSKEEPVVDNNEPINLEVLTNTELSAHMQKTLLNSMSSLIDKKLSPIGEKVTSINNHEASKQKAKFEKDIKSMVKKHPDFDSRRESMQEIAKAPKLSIDEIYWLDKRRKGEVEEHVKDTERPSTSSSRPPMKELRKTPLPVGKAGANVLLSEAFAQIPVPTQESAV